MATDTTAEPEQGERRASWSLLVPAGKSLWVSGRQHKLPRMLLPRHELCVGRSSVEQGSVALGRRSESASVPGRYEFICLHSALAQKGA